VSETVHQVGARPGDGSTATTATAREVAQTVGDQTMAVMSDVREQAGDVMAKARDESKRLLDEGTREFREQADSQLTRAASFLRTFSDRLVAMCEGRAAEAGPLPDLARDMSMKVRDFATGLDQRGFDGALHEVRRFARRRPGTFLLAASGLGFLAGRGLRATRDHDSANGDGERAPQLSSPPRSALSGADAARTER